MKVEPIPDHSEPAAGSVAANILAVVEDFLRMRVPAEVLTRDFEVALGGIPLYPPMYTFGVGVAAGRKLETHPAIAIDLALKLISSAERETRAAAVGLIFWLARFQPGFWNDIVRHLLTDDDWEVRDLAARIFDVFEGQSGAAEYHFQYVREAVTGWIGDPDERIRRAATHALLGYAAAHPEFRPEWLSLIGPLVYDEREYVRFSLAAALRSMGRTDPGLVFAFLDEVVDSKIPHAGDTVRLVLDHPFAERFPERKHAILQRVSDSQA